MPAIRKSRVSEGSPNPRGATWDGLGVNFALFSANATKVELCLFDDTGRTELERIELPEYTDEVCTGICLRRDPVPIYGYRVHGPHDPRNGHRFNPHKLLLDPYAKAFVGALRWDNALFGYTIGARDGDLSFDRRDSARYMPKCRVIDPAFTWGRERRPDVPWHRTLLYETHVRGYTKQHPAVPENLRGTFSGLGPQRGHRLYPLTRRHLDRTPAHPCLCQRPAFAGKAPDELLGLQHDRLLRS